MKQDWCNIGVGVPWRSAKDFTDILVWLTDNIDERDWDWDVSMNGLFHRIYYFAHEKDAIWFTLRWS